MRFEDIPLMDSKWRDRPLSNLIKWMLVQGTVSYEDAAACLNVSVDYFYNKMNRSSFTLFEVLKIADICGCDIDFSVRDRFKWCPFDYYDAPLMDEGLEE